MRACVFACSACSPAHRCAHQDPFVDCYTMLHFPANRGSAITHISGSPVLPDQNRARTFVHPHHTPPGDRPPQSLKPVLRERPRVTSVRHPCCGKQCTSSTFCCRHAYMYVTCLVPGFHRAVRQQGVVRSGPSQQPRPPSMHVPLHCAPPGALLSTPMHTLLPSNSACSCSTAPHLAPGTAASGTFRDSKTSLLARDTPAAHIAPDMPRVCGPCVRAGPGQWPPHLAARHRHLLHLPAHHPLQGTHEADAPGVQEVQPRAPGGGESVCSCGMWGLVLRTPVASSKHLPPACVGVITHVGNPSGPGLAHENPNMRWTRIPEPRMPDDVCSHRRAWPKPSFVGPVWEKQQTTPGVSGA